ncbi:MAG TPA: cytochrome c [Chthoniobacterales bacterium]|nr:cytochrome c [Chthoniobacterales bacterium]
MRSARFAIIILLGALTGCGPTKEARQWAADITGGNPERGKNSIQQYGCIACHTIDGISSEAVVGPALTRMASRSYLAGNMNNSATNMARFIQHPRQVHPDTAMPEMNVTDSDARDIAAYLYSFK